MNNRGIGCGSSSSSLKPYIGTLRERERERDSIQMRTLWTHGTSFLSMTNAKRVALLSLMTLIVSFGCLINYYSLNSQDLTSHVLTLQHESKIILLFHIAYFSKHFFKAFFKEFFKTIFLTTILFYYFSFFWMDKKNFRKRFSNFLLFLTYIFCTMYIEYSFCLWYPCATLRIYMRLHAEKREIKSHAELPARNFHRINNFVVCWLYTIHDREDNLNM